VKSRLSYYPNLLNPLAQLPKLDTQVLYLSQWFGSIWALTVKFSVNAFLALIAQ
jgi:hypothetical protein